MMVGPSLCSTVIPVEEPAALKIGHRINYSGYRGTLLYVGQVPPTKGTWLGIDWDDPKRGKHDGTHEGCKYFVTRHPTSGSFVRPGKVDFGQSCVDAIRSRYGELKNSDIDTDSLALLKKEMNVRFLEVVGLEKINKIQSQFANLKRVILDGYNVNGAGSPQELHSVCPNVEELDLSQNLLNSWAAVAEITGQLGRLRVLNVSENQLTIPSHPEQLRDAFLAVEHVIAGYMEYMWADVVKCISLWPHVRKLQVPYNHITLLEPPPPHILFNLTFLDLDDNPIGDWGEVNKLGRLPRLEILNISKAGLSAIHFPTEDHTQKTDLFPVLKELCLIKNKIASWQSICELHKLKELEVLKLLENPLLQLETSETCHQFIIARIANLKKLNGLVVTQEERKGAEYDYLKRHGQQWLKIEKSQDKEALQDFLSTHTRYKDLVEKHGAPEEGEVRILPKTLKSKLISVELYSLEQPARSFKKRLPRTMFVQKLVGLAQKLFDTGNEFPELAYRSSKNPDVEIPLSNALKELQFYSVEDGDRISVRW